MGTKDREETDDGEEELEDVDESDVIPKKKPAMFKRPSAASSPAPKKKKEKKLSVCKYMYTTGKWAFKINQKEVMGVT